jgi:tetratricopeptide (TPR) repeat protein
MNTADAMLNLGLFDDAMNNYHAALELAQRNNDIRLGIDISAGLAQASLAKGEPDRALGIIEEILVYLGIEDQSRAVAPLYIGYSSLEGLYAPFQVLLTCYRVLQANQDHRADPLLGAAYRLLLEQANHLPSEQVQANFLGMIPAHSELCMLYEQLIGETNGGPL